MTTTFKPLAMLAGSAALAAGGAGLAHAAEDRHAPAQQQAPVTQHAPVAQSTPSVTPGFIAIDDARVREPARGSRRLVLTVRRTPALGTDPARLVPASVRYATVARSAKPGRDYRSARGTLTFAAGQTTGRIAIAVLGDRRREGSESLRVVLSGAAGALVTDARAWATILDNGCDCTDVDAALELPTAADERVVRLWPAPPAGFKVFEFMTKTAVTCSPGLGGCVGEVVLKGRPGVAHWNVFGPNFSEVIECAGPCGKTTAGPRTMVRLYVPKAALTSDEPYELKLDLLARCPMSKGKTVTVTLNFLRGSLRPRFSDLDGDGKADRA